MNLIKIIPIYFFLFSLTTCKIDRGTYRDSISYKVEVLDSFQLESKTYISLYSDYHPNKEIFVSVEGAGKKILISDAEGHFIREILIPQEGPDKIIDLINVIFDLDEEELLILSATEIISLSLEGKIIKRCPLKNRGIIYGGFDPPRLIVDVNFYFVSLLDSKDLAFGIGTKQFLEQAFPIKVYDKKSCKCINQIPYPKTSKLQEGLFQPTFYEPMMAIDRINKELELLYPRVEDVIYRFDIKQNKYIASIDLNLGLDFAESVDFKAKNLLDSKFQKDHRKALFFNILNFDSKTLVCYKHATGSIDNDIYYKIYNNEGVEDGELKLKTYSNIDYLIAHKAENIFFAFPDFDRFTEEPDGYPINVIRLIPD